jgi:uncharacterized protein
MTATYSPVTDAVMKDDKQDDVHQMLLTVIRSLVDRPEDVVVTPHPGETSLTFRVQAHPSDMGKLIGVNGRTARALRIILGANAARLKRNLSLDILQADQSAAKLKTPAF